LEQEWITIIAESILDFQRKEILKWAPENSGGLAKTLTETPIGEALGLTQEQQEDLRKKFDKIGLRLFKEYVRSRLEAEKIFAEALTEEQIKKLQKLYAPGRSSQYSLIRDAVGQSDIIQQ